MKVSDKLNTTATSPHWELFPVLTGGCVDPKGHVHALEKTGLLTKCDVTQTTVLFLHGATPTIL